MRKRFLGQEFSAAVLLGLLSAMSLPAIDIEKAKAGSEVYLASMKGAIELEISEFLNGTQKSRNTQIETIFKIRMINPQSKW